MKVINQSYKILTPINKQEILKKLEEIGRTAYKSEDLITDESSNKFIKIIMDKKHESVIEHHLISVKITTNRSNSHEAVRHRVGTSFCQESTRYCNYSKGKFGGELTFINPDMDEESKEFALWKNTMETIESNYMKMIELGVKPEKARSILPNSLKTDIVLTLNLRAWRHFFDLRCDKSAHPDIRSISLELLDEFNKELPEIFGDLYERFFGHRNIVKKVCYITNREKIDKNMIKFGAAQISKYNTLIEANIQSLKKELNKGDIDIDIISSIVGSRNDVKRFKPYYFIDLEIYYKFIKYLTAKPQGIEFVGLNKKEAEYIVSILFCTSARDGLIIEETGGKNE